MAACKLLADSYRQQTTPHKDRANEILAELSAEHRLLDKHALVLDGVDIRSTCALLGAGMASERILVPNFTESYEAIHAQHEQAYHMTIGELLALKKDALRGEISVAFFDYCAAFHRIFPDGSSPRTDLLRFFAQGFPADRSLLMLTVSTRCRPGYAETVEDHIHEIRHTVVQYARAYGYQAKRLPRYELRYRPNMYLSVHLINQVHERSSDVLTSRS